jgi:hypothetical protein
MTDEFSMFGKVTTCNYCGKPMSFFAILNHEEKCRKIKHLCDRYNDCKNTGVLILSDGKKKSRWCFSCLDRYKKEHPEIQFEFSGIKVEVKQDKPTTDGIHPTPKGAGILPNDI